MPPCILLMPVSLASPRGTPMRRAIRGLGVQRPVDRLRHSFVVRRSRPSRTQFVLQTKDVVPGISRTPLVDRVAVDPQRLGNFRVGLGESSAGQDDARAQRQRGWQRPRSGHRDELRRLDVGEVYAAGASVGVGHEASPRMPQPMQVMCLRISGARHSPPSTKHQISALKPNADACCKKIACACATILSSSSAHVGTSSIKPTT